MSESFHYQDLIAVFDATFSAEFNTRLVRGTDEPVYLPADQTSPWHRIIFAHGYFASALHEIAHWCIAGASRRQRVDFGYWYIPDGRNTEQQAAFEVVEIKPQALEWAFSVACGAPFRVSTDNLHGAAGERLLFQHRVYDQVCHYLANGFPAQGKTFIAALRAFYHRPPLSLEHFHYRGMYER